MSEDCRGADPTKLQRMLLWFESQLPPHKLGYWYVTRQAQPVILENDEPPRVHRAYVMSFRDISISGFAECVSCRKRFNIQTTSTLEERIEKAVAEAKARVEREAERDGPCWGGVPRISDKSYVAVLDGRG